MGRRRRDEVVDVLRQRFLSASHLGLVAPGAKLPSARDVSRELSVDRRVVLAAYRMLEREGIVELRQRSGIYFAPAAAGTLADASRRGDWMVDVLHQGIAHGTPAPALAELVHRHVSTLRLHAACLECNDDQIDLLRAELGADYGFASSGVEIDPLHDDTALLAGDGPAEPPPALRRADLLVTTPFHASEVKAVAERLGKPWIAVTLRADLFAEIARRLAAGPVFAVVADPRFAYKLGRIYASTPGASNFRALVVGRDDLRQIPAGAPVYVTRLGRERPDGAPLAGQVIVEPRVFSSDSARELLAFVVRANMRAVSAEGGAPG